MKGMSDAFRLKRVKGFYPGALWASEAAGFYRGVPLGAKAQELQPWDERTALALDGTGVL